MYKIGKIELEIHSISDDVKKWAISYTFGKIMAHILQGYAIVSIKFTITIKIYIYIYISYQFLEVYPK